MSHWKDDPEVEGLRTLRNGAHDFRARKNRVGASLAPRSPFGDIVLSLTTPGKSFSLFLTVQDAYDMADALDVLLADVEKDPRKVRAPEAK